MTTTLPILLGWRAEDCWSLWFVGIGGAALRLLQPGFCGMLCLPVTSGARTHGPEAAFKWLLSSQELLVVCPLKKSESLPIYFTNPRSTAVFGEATSHTFRDLPLSKHKSDPQDFSLSVFLFKKKKRWLLSAVRPESPTQRLCSPARGRTLERGHGACLTAPLPAPGFPEALGGFRTAEE